jgi:hypothetical protein
MHARHFLKTQLPIGCARNLTSLAKSSQSDPPLQQEFAIVLLTCCKQTITQAPGQSRLLSAKRSAKLSLLSWPVPASPLKAIREFIH